MAIITLLRFLMLKSRTEISISTDISVLGFYEIYQFLDFMKYIGYIGDISVDIFT